MSFPRYASYKPSGVEWVGEVPEHWSLMPLKRIGNFRAGSGFPHDAQGVADAELSFHKVNSLAQADADGYLTPSANSVSHEKAAELRAVVFPPETIVFAKIGAALLLGRVRRLRAPSCLDNNMMGFTVRPPSSAGYFRYAFHQLRFDYLANPGAVPSLNEEQIRRLCIAVPPDQEQRTIVAFLDRETAKIDALVDEQKRLIALLKEKRQAVISHAVTKGLDPNAPMKDSGIEWLGDVPAHWEVGPLKRFTDFLDGKRVPLSAEERSARGGAFPYYGASGIIDWIDDYIFDEECVLVAEDGANLLSRSTPIAFVANGRYWVNNHAHILRPHDQMSTYWAARIEAIDVSPWVTGAAQPKLTADALANLSVAVPPTREERERIEEVIRTVAISLQPLICEAERAVWLLAERRAALISAAVTGKIDVRGAVSIEAAA